MTGPREWILQDQGEDRENACRWKRYRWRLNDGIYKIERVSKDGGTKYGEAFYSIGASHSEFETAEDARKWRGSQQAD